MSDPLPVGTRVRLNDRGLRVFATFKPEHQGTVCGVSRRPMQARVKWDHLKVPKSLHAAAFLEVVPDSEPEGER